MFKVFSTGKTALTQSYVFTGYAFINGAFIVYLLQLASIAVVIVANSYFFTVDTFFDLIFFNFYNPQILLAFDIPTKWAFNNPIIFQLIFHPLREAIKMESISTDISTRCSRIAFDDLHMADGT